MLNSGGKATVLMMNNQTPIASAIEQLVPVLEDLKIPFLCVVDFEFEEFISGLENSSLKSRVRFQKSSYNTRTFWGPLQISEMVGGSSGPEVSIAD